MTHRLRAAALILATGPVLAACGSMVEDEEIGTAPQSTPEDNSNVSFIRYAAIGTSIGAGIQSGGILDSTQREAYTYRLALAMGLTPGVNWFYPSLAYPGCPAPYTNILTGVRLAGSSATACALRTPGSARPFESNTAIPFLRAIQAYDIDTVPFPTDTLKLQQFLVGAYSPVQMVTRQANATFVTLEVGANDVLHAATQGNAALLTPTANFTAHITNIADSLDAFGIRVAIANIPNVTAIPFMTKASTLFCLKTGACGIPATLPYSSPLFTVDPSCAPNLAGGFGDNYLLSFPTTAAVTTTLAASRAAKIDCGRDSTLVATTGNPLVATAPAGATVNLTEYPAITGAVTAMNSAIATLANARNYALADFNAALAALPTCTSPTTPAACVPAVPFFTTPSALFGPVFSLDGVHPNRAGQRLIAQAFAAAINAEFGTTLTVP